MSSPHFVDLSHVIEDGMTTYPGLPAPHVCDFLSRDASRSRYAAGTTFQIGRIELVANTGTYLDSPFHRYEDGRDISQLTLAELADLPAIVLHIEGARSIDVPELVDLKVRDRALLVHTGWAQHWRTERYGTGHPYLTAAAASWLKDEEVRLVGIDSLNIDDTTSGERPVHTTLLGAGIPIVEHLRGLEQLPDAGFTFSAVPPAVRGMGSFPVRAYARI